MDESVGDEVVMVIAEKHFEDLMALIKRGGWLG